MEKTANLQSPAISQEEPYPSESYAWYVVGVLTIVYIFSFIDRQILNLLVGPIRRDLGISDTQMSWLMGTSFAVFYTFFGIILGRLADSRSRRSLIALGFIFWSIMTAGCGLARNFTQMLLLRMGVGVGEATLSPSAYSLISDYFPKEKRATAISVYSMGIYIGSGIAFLLGGAVIGYVSTQGTIEIPIIGSIRPWQAIFLIVGMPGVLLSLLMYTVKEPIRRGVRSVQLSPGTGKQSIAPLKEVLSYVRSNSKTFVCHTVGFALLSFSSYGTSAWIASSGPSSLPVTTKTEPRAIVPGSETAVRVRTPVFSVICGFAAAIVAQSAKDTAKRLACLIILLCFVQVAGALRRPGAHSRFCLCR